jgi:hypothetical protein
MNQHDFVNVLAKLRPSATFLQLHKYQNEVGEVANYNIVFHVSYKSALERSILSLESYHPLDDLEAIAKDQLLDSHRASLSKLESSSDSDERYSYFYDSEGSVIKGVKLHKLTNTLHLYGAVVSKKVTTPVVRKVTNKSGLTLAKDKLRQLTPLSAFCQFKITSDKVDKISVEKLQIKPKF